ncbi:MAG: peptidyl-prolyl cis-trans isomerase [Cyclobacteriaceae bacterium]|nr:peptidyl-prolyl cis-trans isomerase [Cyclobacteriaceae bacterium]
MNKIHYLFALTILLTSCDLLVKKKGNTERTAVARAGDIYLYHDELTGLVPSKLSKEDSSKLIDKFVNDWIKKQLMVNRAKEEIAFDELEIERKVLDYRYALIAHEFEKHYINSHLNLEVPESEIEAYYREWADNFILKQNIVKCLFVQVSKTAPGIAQLRRNIRSFPASGKKDLEDYASQYGMKSFLDDSLWINFDEVIQLTPLKDISDKTQFLRSTSYSETSDETYLYFLRILEYRISDQISPISFIYDDIENIIINKRKLALKKDLEKAIYDEALSQNNFEIYN